MLWPLLHSLKRDAVAVRGVPDCTVTTAMRATARRFSEHADAPLDAAERSRVIAYFWGTVRRRALRDSPSYMRRIVRATMAADLEEAGWDRRAIAAELERLGLSA